MMGTLAIVILDLDDGTIMIMMLINILPLLIETLQRQKKVHLKASSDETTQCTDLRPWDKPNEPI